MPKKERVREPLSALPTLEYLIQRMEAGWKLVTLEWERDAKAEGAEPPTYVEEIPYGLQVSADCAGLVESPSETQVIILALDMIVEDHRLSRVADELNRRGYLTRAGMPWTPTTLFNLLPRMIQVGPRVFASEEWMTRRQRLPKVV
ncbi:MAG: recombinase family protein [Bryobacteraceae bacterium]|jgi:hypothetical protein